MCVCVRNCMCVVCGCEEIYVVFDVCVLSSMCGV